MTFGSSRLSQSTSGNVSKAAFQLFGSAMLSDASSQPISWNMRSLFNQQRTPSLKSKLIPVPLCDMIFVTRSVSEFHLQKASVRPFSVKSYGMRQHERLLDPAQHNLLSAYDKCKFL